MFDICCTVMSFNSCNAIFLNQTQNHNTVCRQTQYVSHMYSSSVHMLSLSKLADEVKTLPSLEKIGAGKFQGEGKTNPDYT